MGDKELVDRITTDPPHTPARLDVRCDCSRLVGSYRWEPPYARNDNTPSWHFEDHAGRWFLDPLTAGPLNVRCEVGHPCEITPARAVRAIVSGVRTIRLRRR